MAKVAIMNERIARLRAIERNIARYQGLLKSNLSDIELRFVERRLSEERFALAKERSMSPAEGSPPDVQ